MCEETFLIKGQNEEIIMIEATYDKESPADLLEFENEEDRNEYLEKFESGEFLNMHLKATFYDKELNLLSVDHLSNVEVRRSNSSFELKQQARFYWVY